MALLKEGGEPVVSSSISIRATVYIYIKELNRVGRTKKAMPWLALKALGDYFGENALLRDEPRSATILAKNELFTFRISRQAFEDMGLREKLDFPIRKAVAGGAIRELALKKNENLWPGWRKA